MAGVPIDSGIELPVSTENLIGASLRCLSLVFHACFKIWPLTNGLDPKIQLSCPNIRLPT